MHLTPFGKWCCCEVWLSLGKILNLMEHVVAESALRSEYLKIMCEWDGKMDITD